MTDVSIVVVSYNTSDLIQKCIDSVIKPNFITIDLSAGLHELVKGNINIYPVPFKDELTLSFTDNLTGAAYQWQMNAGTGYSDLSNAGQFSGTDTQTLTISSTAMINNNTLYRCVVTESASCTDTTDVSTLTVIDNTSITELNNSLVKLFPNPSNGNITLDIAQHANGQIILTDILGKEVLNKSFTSKDVQINLKSLASKGTYFVKVIDLDGNVIAIKKLIYQ